MFQIIGYIIIFILTWGAFFCALAAGVYVGIRQEELNQEDGNK